MEKSNNCKKIILFAIPVIIWLAYTGVLTDGKFQASSDELNYFKDLSISFAHGRLDIERPLRWMPTLDLVSFEGKYYLYWPPAPAVVYMPFTGIWGRNTPDTVIVASFGALNILLLIILLDLFSKRYGLKIGCEGIIFLSVFWALGTVHFYLSRIGNVWCTAQIMAQTFLMLSIIFMLARTSFTTLFLSGLFYSLAVYTRNHLVFSIVLIVAIYVTKDAWSDRKVFVRNCMAFLVPFLLFSTANMLYNHARFGNAFDNGLKYHKMDPHFAANFQDHGVFSLHYVPDNFAREVIAPPPFKSGFPFFDLDPEGFGFLWASPVFIFVFAAAFYYLNEIRNNLMGNRAGLLSRNDIIVMSGAAISGVLIALLIFMVMGTGWMQFASRYSLDYQLALLLFGIFIVKIWKGRFFKGILIILLLYSIHMNYFGMKYYLHLLR